ncbi:MAG: tRNA lysidine(34) synthetase TilS [Candidatus Acidiferrales bacterium]
MITPGDRAGVAVSGGADSVALLRILEELREDLGITLLVVHFDHQLRGAESKADARFVADLARRSGLDFIVDREDVAASAALHGWNLEDAARRLRYGFFQRVIEQGHATRIAVAHTADDQAETVLAHLFRGTGFTGLAGIYPCVGSTVRPILETRRHELRAFLSARGESWCEDATNQDTRHMRARIRQQLLPVLERDFSPAIVNHLGELSRFAREEESFWTVLVEDRFLALAKKSGDAWAISIHDLLEPLGSLGRPIVPDSFAALGSTSAPLRSLTERLIRRLYEVVRGDRRDLAACHVEQVIYLATESSSGKGVELPGGIVAEREFDEIIFARRNPAIALSLSKETNPRQNAYHYVVRLPARGATTVSIPEIGTCISLKVIDWSSTPRDTKRDGKVLDAALLRSPLILRNWRPGDGYRPHGRRQARKLKQMFLLGRVPSRERASWPVLESHGRVIWARGMPLAEDFCAREGTRRGVVIEEDRL